MLELQMAIASDARFAHLSLVKATEASRAVTRHTGPTAGGKKGWLVVDTVSAFDGLERLIVIAVALDSVIGNKQTAQTRSELYRAITRAHMMVVVVNELLRDGWLEWLTRLQLDEHAKFDAEAEILGHDDRAARSAITEHDV